MGLGNPGPKYSETRHNAGFLLIDSIIDQWKAEVLPRGRNYWLWQTRHRETAVYLMKPTTYMNLSGRALVEFLMNVPLDREQILIVYDDLALPLGQIRVRSKGSDGGQKGLRDICECLQTNQVARIRLGIGPLPQELPRVDYVLQKFGEDERVLFDKACERAILAASDWLKDSMQTVMSRYNAKVPQDNIVSEERTTPVEGRELK